MLPVASITPDFSVSGDLQPQDYQALADAGFKMVINNRPDGEEPGQMTHAQAEAAADAAGLRYVFLPIVSGQISPDQVREMHAALQAAEGPVLAHCRSGGRCSVLWALQAVSTQPVEKVLSATANAGYNNEGIRPTLEALQGKPPGGQ